VHHHDFMSRDEAKLAIFDYIKCFDHRNRIHQSLGYCTQDEMERLYYKVVLRRLI
jgi:transposase InsO family protein